MPRDAAGNYSLPGAYNPVIVNELITAEWANTTLDDMATALTSSLDRDGNGGMLGPFRLSDGTLNAPGIGFTNETNSGIARLSSAAVSVVVTAVETMRAGPTNVTFLVYPQTSLAPVVGNDLVNLTYAGGTYAPLLDPTFSPLGFPSWDGTPTLPEHLANKEYADTLAFNTVLPDSSGQPEGAVIAINGNGNPAWSGEPAEIDALSILAYLTV